MLRNYLKIAWRNIVKSRFYSAVNIFGLAVGSAFTLLICSYVWSELQVNKSLKNADRQYIIQSKWKDPNQGFAMATLGPLAKELKERYPDLVANYYRFDGVSSNVSKGDRSFRENLQIGDSTMLNMFGFGLMQGNAKTALNAPFTVVVTKDKAIKYFGKADVVGNTITIESFSGSKHDFLITGVLSPMPRNSVTALIENYPGDFYVSTDNLAFFGRGMSWQNPFIVNYVELQQGISPKDLEGPIAHLEKQNAPPEVAADLTPYLVPLRDFHLTANQGLIQKMIYALSAIALFILVMAIINFINMSVSRSAARMREIGIRKVLGGLKRQLIIQFLTESIIITLFATALAFVFYASVSKLFGNMLGAEIPKLNGFPLYFIAFPLLFIGVVGFIAGIYPAFVLSSLKSVDSLKGKITVKDNVFLRRFLIAFQFGIAAMAFIGAMIISEQTNLFLNTNLGYDKDYILSAQVPRDWTQPGANKMEGLRNQFSAMSQVSSVSLSYEIPDGNSRGSVGVYRFGTDSVQAITAETLTTDENYLNVYRIPVKAGSFFEGQATDSGKVILNETAVQALGLKSAYKAIGQQLRLPGDPTVFAVKGVVSDFHFGSMQKRIAPVIFFDVQTAPLYRYLSFKLNPGNIPAAIQALQKKWNMLMPGAPFEYKFMDDTLANVYKTELQLKKASYTATILALIIVLLGVVGLISLSIQKRTKEIGVRKVLGSSIAGIMVLFIKEFLWVILVGGAVACPLSYMIMYKWLQHYAYRIDITAAPFVLTMACLGLITVSLICVQTVRAALANPVASLRTEG